MTGQVLLNANYGTLLLSHKNADVASLTTGTNFVTGSDTNSPIDNTTSLQLWLDILVKLGSINPTGSPYVSLSTLTSMDGTNFEDPQYVAGTQSATAPPAGMPTWTRGVTTGSSAKVIIFRNILIGPGKTYLVFGNFTGQTLNASANSITYWKSNYQDNG